MTIPFTKMHGLGNDFIIVDTREREYPLDTNTIRTMSDRHHGIGCDQFVTLSAPTNPKADVLVRFFNADGSEAGACGNASRCVAKFVGNNPVLQTQNGLLPTYQQDDLFTVNMGKPHLDWQSVPLSEAHDTLHLPLHDAAACSMGNPHATLFGDVSQAEELGPSLENAPLFPERANIGFAQILSPNHMRLRVWERGAGLTLACGSGACAAVVNASRRNLTEKTCRVTMDGGDLSITWQEDGTVLMTGPATLVFHGEFA
ncbi:diaminopimelate epimerase [Swingsia samuiensis]|uniref:Diaminopimelate epimerase n=1 Tax=Swingsia samuiensis TaxID=1293412 RepID=A0A4Y6UKE2_9PROT|nr:diaminopimelate epimerase [Swingsia samuiensis]QDH18022.1 diaminopimelate epimerase [Swingsia samuiensis]